MKEKLVAIGQQPVTRHIINYHLLITLTGKSCQFLICVRVDACSSYAAHFLIQCLPDGTCDVVIKQIVEPTADIGVHKKCL